VTCIRGRVWHAACEGRSIECFTDKSQERTRSDRGLMRLGKSEWQGCVTPIPKDARAGFEKARGEFCAYPTGCGERSRRRRAGLICQSVSDAGPKRLCKAEGLSWAYTAGKPCKGVQPGGRSFLLVLLRREVASTARCQRGLGIGSLLAIVRPGRAGDGSGVTG
jgi:hypothetical protein